MNKVIRNILLVITIMSAFMVKAETVSQKPASKLAQTFFNTLYEEVTAPPKMVWNGRQLTTNRLFTPFYIYNSPKGGFVIISAENKAYPILAYSKAQIFNRDQLGESETTMLKKFAKEIELIRYDSRVPEKAIAAWQNVAQYISSTIHRPYSTEEYTSLDEEHKENIELIDRRNSWVMMPTAVEFKLYDPDDYRDLTLDDVTEEEIPFAFYNDFIATVKREQEEQELALAEELMPTRPVVKSLGGGHFVITLPEEARMMRIYGMDGNLGLEKYYKGTTTVNINIESLPQGYYVGLVLTADGKVYGFKLFR